MCASLAFTVSAADTEITGKDKWVITESSYASGKPGTNVFDDNKSTFWHSYYIWVAGEGITEKADEPHWIEVEFPENTSVTGMILTPRSDGTNTGQINDFKVMYSSDGVNYKEAYSGSVNYGDGYSDISDKKFTWNAVNAKKIKFQTVKSEGGFAAISEISYLTNGAKVEQVKQAEKPKTNELFLKDKVKSITYEGDENPNEDTVARVERLVDGVFGTTKDEAPHWETAIGAIEANDGKSEYANSGKKGIVTIELKEKVKFNKVRLYARYGWDQQRPTKGMLYISDDGKTWTKSSENFTGGYKDETLDFSMMSNGKAVTVEAKFIRIEVTNTYSGVWACEEISVFQSDDKAETITGQTATDVKIETKEDVTSNRLPRDGWTAVASSTAAGAVADKILDGNDNTYWHSWYRLEGGSVAENDPAPFQLDFTLPEETLISGVVFTPRKDSNSGRILEGNLYVSDSDDGEWFLLREGMSFEDTAIDKEILFGANLKVKRIRFEVTGTRFGTMAEFYAVKPDDKFETYGYAEYLEKYEELMDYEIDNSMFKATYEGAVWEDRTADKAIDGNDKTYWQTDAISQWQNLEEYSVILDVDLSAAYKIKKLDIIPRQTPDFHGCWMKFDIQTSVDGVNWTVAKENLTYEKSIATKTVEFEDEIKARYFKFIIKEAHASRVACAELKFYQSKAGRDEFLAGAEEKYVLHVGDNKISAHKDATDTDITLDVAPFIVNGSTMIPLRGLLEAMGATVTWNGETQEITIVKGEYNIKLQIWNRLVYVNDPTLAKYGEIRYTLLNEPIIKDSRTFIPIRFVSEQLGYDVAWDASTQMITITNSI